MSKTLFKMLYRYYKEVYQITRCVKFVLGDQKKSLEHILPFTFIMISTELVIIVLSVIGYVYLVNYEAVVIY